MNIRYLRAATALLLAVGTISAGAVVVAAVGARQSTVSTGTSDFLSTSDQDQLGLHLSQLPSNAAAPQVLIESAVKTASATLHSIEAPAQVLHVMAAPDASSAERSVYVVIFSGGVSIPGGPQGNSLHPVTYRGVVVDDQTGEVLRIFATGNQ